MPAVSRRCDATTNTFDFATSISPSTTFHLLRNSVFSCDPAFAEAAFAERRLDACQTTIKRLSIDEANQGDTFWEPFAFEMDGDPDQSIKRSSSQYSNASARSQRSATVRVKPRKYASFMSSSASSIASDKSLTSFPSFAPESPRDERPLPPRVSDGTASSFRSASDPSSIVESLITSSPSLKRSPLFDDASPLLKQMPGALHIANDEHIERLIARNGAVALVRTIASDLAQRDEQISVLRRKAEDRERAFRSIILDSGMSNMDLEAQLRAIEGRQSARAGSMQHDSSSQGNGLVDMMHDAMTDNVVLEDLNAMESDATIRATDALRALQTGTKQNNTTQRGWKDYLWGTGTTRKTAQASSPHPEAGSVPNIKNGASGRRTVLENGFFQPPEATENGSKTPSMHSSNQGSTRERKPSSGLATLALKLVAGASTNNREDSRGRASSTGTPTRRVQSTASAKTTQSATTLPSKQDPKPIPRKLTKSADLRGLQDRWDTMVASPGSAVTGELQENFGPVELDTILPPDAQPPTVTQTYNNTFNSEFLTDRFGFIYDQRRKKRQREAAEQMKKTKRGSRGSRIEMLNGSRNGISPLSSDLVFDEGDDRPDTPISSEEKGEDGKPVKRWQDYLKIATFPTELLSHTPASGVPAFEVMEGGEVSRLPSITSEERGFLPTGNTAVASPVASVTSDDATISKPHVEASIEAPTPVALTTEDTEPVKLLLKQLGEVHDSLQREKAAKWNDFLRKVRAERRRDGEAAAAAYAADTRSQRPMAAMPEASLTDGEMIGVAGLGNKGKVGRAKWNEFKGLVLGGIPVAYRAKIWAECSGATALRIPGYYEDLVSRKAEDDDPAITAQIRMDINRTLTDNIFFRKGPGVVKLSEVLLAYSRRNPEVGYCQGMNLITACLLLIMPTAEDTFWVLTSIIENILPRGYYDHSLLASRADQQVLRQYVSEILPKLSFHLDDLGIELEALTFQWFLSVFTDCLSAEALFRLWDVVFCTNDGSTFLFQVALALLKLNETQLLQCSTPASIYTYINHQVTNHAISIDGLIHASEGLRKVVKRDEVENRRTKAIEAEKDLIREREERNNERRAERIAAAAAAAAAESQNEIASTDASADVSPAEVEEEEALEIITPRPAEEDRQL